MLRTLIALLVLAMMVMAFGYLLIGTGYALVHFARQSWDAFRVRDTEGPSPDPVPEAPAYRPYLLHQGWRDLRVVPRETGRRLWFEIARLHRRFWDWFRDASPPLLLLSLPLAASLVVGTALVAVPVAAGLLALLAVPAVAVALWMVALGVTVATLGLAELGLRALRRIVVACPHPGCYHRFRRPVYGCSEESCQRRHPRLLPGGSGILRHACGCGASLPTLVVLGRYRLPGYCPRCDRPLPRRTGSVRIEHVPVVGGPDAGKSTFLCLAIGALGQVVTGHGGAVDFPARRDELRWRDALVGLRSGVRLQKTAVELPAAVMLDVRPRGASGRILYLFDPAGETFDASELLDSQRYLDHAEVALVVVDPLAIPGVQRAFSEPDRTALARHAAPVAAPQMVRESSGDMIDRLVGVLRTRAEGARLRRVLVVVSKSDLLRETVVGQALGAPEPDVRGWLEEVGWGNWLRALEEECGGQVRYLASGLDIEDAALVAALGWLTGTPSTPDGNAGVRRWLPGRRTTHRPWRSAGRPGRIPRGHAAGRLLMRMVAVPLAIVAAIAPVALLGWWLWELWSPAFT